MITPLHSNALTLTYTYYTGGLQFDGAVPITGATANISVPILSYYHALNFFGRSANIVATLPYGVGNLQGMVQGAEGHVYRSGLLDSVYRFSVNLKGGPAMPLEEMRKWRQKTLIGVSLRVVAPTGQYDPTKLINWGNNRWAFKPRSWLLATTEELAGGCVCGWMVLHHESGILFPQPILSRDPDTIGESDRGI